MLAAYLDRIGLARPVDPTIDGLTELVARHLAAIPFEGFDAFLGRGSARGIAAIHEKLVVRRRGGWCYEQNGLFGWALGEMGFAVTPLSARVNRAEGEAGAHLALLVELAGRRLLVDVGFGGSQALPIDLAPTTAWHEPFAVALTQNDGWWRYTEDPGGAPFFYEFELGPAVPERLAHWQTCQATSPESPFVANLIAQRRLRDVHLKLLGRVLTERGPNGERRRVLRDAAELVAIIEDRFGLDVPEVADKWTVIAGRHEELIGGPKSKSDK